MVIAYFYEIQNVLHIKAEISKKMCKMIFCLEILRYIRNITRAQNDVCNHLLYFVSLFKIFFSYQHES